MPKSRKKKQINKTFQQYIFGQNILTKNNVYL